MALHLERNQEATVWIGGLEPQVDEELLWELMVQAGPVVSVHIPRDRITGEHGGYCFCEFKSEEDADYAMKVMNMVRVYGKSLKINKASRDRKSMDVGANVFVGNLDTDVDDQLLYNTFSAFGQVLTAKVMYEDDGTSKGFGFVNFADFESSDAAILAMSGQFLCNRPIHVSYAYRKDNNTGQRHGTQDERLLAKKMSARYAKRPNMMFADAPVAMQLPRSAPRGSFPPPPPNPAFPPPPAGRGLPPPPPPGANRFPPPPPVHGFAPRQFPPPPGHQFPPPPGVAMGPGRPPMGRGSYPPPQNQYPPPPPQAYNQYPPPAPAGRGMSSYPPPAPQTGAAPPPPYRSGGPPPPPVGAVGAPPPPAVPKGGPPAS